MARGRMLNRSACSSLKIHSLPDDTCRLQALLTIPHLDKNGVFYGSAVMVRSNVFPRRTDVSIEQVEEYLQAMEQAGLIVRFQRKGEMWQVWPGFRDQQPGLRAERETTDYPVPPAEYRQDDGRPPAEGRHDAGEAPEESRQASGGTPAEGEGEREGEEESPPSGDARRPPPQPPPVSRELEATLQTLDGEANPSAVLARWIARLSGQSVDPGRLGKAVRRIRPGDDYRRACKLVAVFALEVLSKRPVGDFVDYLEQMGKGRRRDKRGAIGQDPEQPIDFDKYTKGEYADLFGSQEEES